MMPKRIGALLSKFSTLAPPELSRRKAVAESVEQVLGIAVPVADIQIKSNTAYVNAPPAAKSEIALHQSAIVIAVRERLGEQGGIASVR